MKYKRLSDFADFRTERTANITFENYISTENMIRDKGGIMTVSSLPDAKTTSAYKTGDILLSNIRPYFKKIWFATQSGSCSNDVLVLKTKKNILPLFLYYVLSDDNFFNYDTITSKGTKMPRGTPHAIMKYLVPDIQVDKQTKIASILSAYDDLIENNNKRIKILEQMAENLYKEWFVRFRFPGHETAEFENGIPKEWNRDKIHTYYNTCSGGTPNRGNEEYFENGVYPWVKTGEIKDCVIIDTEEYITQEAVKKSSAKILPSKSLAMAMYGVNIGLLAYLDAGFTCNQACCVFVDKRNFSSINYLYQYLKSIREYLLSISFGAAQQNISQEIIRKIKIIMPSNEIITAFEKQIDNIYGEIRILLVKNKNLTVQRDLLLPRLMSGKLEV